MIVLLARLSLASRALGGLDRFVRRLAKLVREALTMLD
jgi:hypothetical protein